MNENCRSNLFLYLDLTGLKQRMVSHQFQDQSVYLFVPACALSTVSVLGHGERAVRYLMPRGLVVLWAGLALGWCWSFTVCQPGLGIATRLGLGGLGNGAAKRTRKSAKAKRWERARIIIGKRVK